MIAGIKGQLRCPGERIVRPGIPRVGFGDLQEPLAGLIRPLLLHERFGRPEKERRNQRRLWKMHRCFVHGGERKVSMTVFQRECRQSQSGPRGEGLGTLVDQGLEQFLGLFCAIQPRQGLSPEQMPLGFQSTAGRHAIESLERLDRRAIPAAGELGLAKLEQCPVNPVGASVTGQLGKNLDGQIDFAQIRERSAQPIPRAIGKLASREVGQRSLVSGPGRGQIFQPQTDISQIGPGGLQVGMLGSSLHEGFQRRAGRGQIAQHVRKLS